MKCLVTRGVFRMNAAKVPEILANEGKPTVRDCFEMALSRREHI
jgi:hypothetical protein